MRQTQMNTSRLGRFVERHYPALPSKRKWLAAAVRREGGEMFSETLRRVLDKHHGVVAGNYSYGSLLQPGMSDTKTEIGSYVSIGPGVRRFGAAHPLDELSLHPFWYNPALGYVGQDSDFQRTACQIGDDVWIGAGAIILPGCTSIGLGAVIGAGSVITRDVEPFTIVAGNPARVIRTRLDAQTRSTITQSEYWTKAPAEALSTLRSLELLPEETGAR